MRLYLLLFALFLVQEPISSNVAMLQAYQSHYNVWIIHALFALATLFDIVAGYYLGDYIKKHVLSGFVAGWIQNKQHMLARFTGQRSKKLLLFFGGSIIFPISAVLVPWLELTLWESLPYLFVGEVLFWYAGEWLVVLGVKAFVPNPIVALGVGLVIMLSVSLGLRYFEQKTAKK